MKQVRRMNNRMYIFSTNFSVWSMPGGFTSLGGGRSGYEPVDIENEPSSRAAPPPPPVKPSDPPPSVGYQAA